MSLVALKNALLSPSADSKSLLPTAKPRQYNSFSESEDDDTNSTATISYSPPTNSATSPQTGFVDPRVMSDIIIGLSDGLTVPFALTAGLSGLGNSKLVITGGLAELVSGAISMGLGGYLAAKSESEYYETQVRRELHHRKEYPTDAANEVDDILAEFNLSAETRQVFISDLQKQPKEMVDFIVKFGRGLEEPAEGRHYTSAMTIGLSYFFAGFIPLIPYFFTESVQQGLLLSAIVMAITLFIFGALKTVFSLGTDVSKVKVVVNGVQMLLTGSIAAGAAWMLVRAIE
ncbi:DUF125-domain-containing protein [Nadsonia fulvescens var. elongata DSM 6958]|uniref:DUF125-domain-containing protein n=1 Tax=Nadsonia fulvescens var. elongata DSM 6958 TaxID=857566 RepID=A0A1E3PFP4_9ASCO|nr:DUF125-domain-containing protein [Nadsonia fulvescens var. elongata DSM 6958]